MKPQWVVIGSVLAAIMLILLKRFYPGLAILSWPGSSSNGTKAIGAKRSSSSSSSKKKKHRTPSPEALAYSPNLPDFIMLMGIPGSGKSTWAREYVLKCDASFTVVSADEIRKQLVGNMQNQSRNEEVWEVVLNQCQGLLRNGRNVILDATNTGTEKRRKFVAQLPACNKHLKIFHVPKTLAKSRIAKDLQNGVDRAPVPDNVIERMNKQFQDALLAIKDENWLMK